jgi:hypothetical protein
MPGPLQYNQGRCGRAGSHGAELPTEGAGSLVPGVSQAESDGPGRSRLGPVCHTGKATLRWERPNFNEGACHTPQCCRGASSWSSAMFPVVVGSALAFRIFERS